jgi:hypothetical protein
MQANREFYGDMKLVLTACAGIGGPTYLRAVLIGTRVEYGDVMFTPLTEALNTYDGDEQSPVLVNDIK